MTTPNIIRLKRGTTTPTSGSFAGTGELAINTTNGSVFTLTDGGSVIQVGGGGVWGSITGTLSSQSDLASALSALAPLSNPSFTGTISISSSNVAISNSGITYPDGTIQTTASTTFSGGVIASGISLVDGTSTTTFGDGYMVSNDSASGNFGVLYQGGLQVGTGNGSTTTPYQATLGSSGLGFSVDGANQLNINYNNITFPDGTTQTTAYTGSSITVPDAVSDGTTYARQNGAWTNTPNIVSLTLNGTSIQITSAGYYFPDGSLQTTAATAGVAEAPMDGYIYARQSGNWVYATTTGGQGIGDAPSDGNYYSRVNGNWSINNPTGLGDAPSDGYTYGRYNGSWVNYYYGSSFIINGTTTQLSSSGLYFPDGTLQTTASSGSPSTKQIICDNIAANMTFNFSSGTATFTGFVATQLAVTGKYQSYSNYQIGIGSASQTPLSYSTDGLGNAIAVSGYVSYSSGAYLFYSEDYGATWTQSSFSIF